MKKIIGFIAGLIIFPSVCLGHWVDEQKTFLQEKGVLQDVFDDNSIDSALDRPITREEFFSLVAIADNTSQIALKGNFIDINDVNSKFSSYIGGLVDSGIVSGSLKDDKLYIYPKTPITRQEASVILGKILDLKSEKNEIKFTDSKDIADWARQYLIGVNEVGIVNGYEDNTVRPLGNITVAETIAVITNSYNKGYFSDELARSFAGTGEGALKDGTIFDATFSLPSDIVIKDGKLYIADAGNNSIRMIENNIVKTFVGSDIGRNEYNEAIGSFRDGKDALFDTPSYMAALENGILVTDKGNNLIRFISDEGDTTTFAGNLDTGFVNGNIEKAKFSSPTGIAVDSKGNIYISDTGNNVIRMIDINKNVTTFAGNKKAGYKDGNLKTAQFNSPMGIEIVNDIIYIADTGNQRIRMIKDGIVSTYAGNGTDKDDYGIEILGDFIDGNKNTAKFNYPVNIELDNNGNLYVADKGNGAIRKIDTKGNVTTVIKDTIKRPMGMAIKDNMLYVTDTLLNRIFKIKL